MKSIITLFLLGIVALNAHSQTEQEIEITDVFGKTFNAILKVDIDTVAFDIYKNNKYYHKNDDAIFSVNYAAQAYSATAYGAPHKDSDVKLIEAYELVFDGMPCFYKKQERFEDDSTVVIVTYIKKYGYTGILIINGEFEKNKAEYYEPMLENVAKSVQLIKQ